MHKPLIILAFSCALWGLAAQAETFTLSEDSLEAQVQKGAPQLDQISSAYLNAAVKQGETAQEFAPELFGKGSYTETNERAILQFQPIFTPIKQAQLGVRQKNSLGLETSAYVTTDQRTAASPFIGKINNATTSTIAFTMQMDIWKDLFGKTSKLKLESADLDKKRAELERDIQVKAFRISLRRLYWSLVANNEAIKISSELKKTSERQLSETKQRLRNSVAEPDEVARYEAQAASRQGTILYLEYQRETFRKQLKNLLPELAGKDIELEKYDLDETLNQVLACTVKIAQEQNVPYKYTQYDEAMAMLRKIKSNNANINSRYADADVKLFGTVKATGVSSDAIGTNYYNGNYRGSIQDIEDTNRTGYEVGVSFTVPLGKAKANTQKSKELYDEKRLLASIDATDAQVVTTHEQLVKSIKLLTDVTRAQKVNSTQLEKRLKLMRRKYEQARISVSDLVQDQDALLNSQLTVIDTELQILNTLFDYLVIFTETPCPFNRI